MSLTLQQIYEHAIGMGRKNDPRTIKEIEDNLKEIKKEYQKMDKKKKIYFDLEKLTNPYSDSRVLHGKLNQVVKTMMVCIDGDMQELLLVNALRANGQKIDLLFVHHPEGRGLVDLTRVMPIQESVMAHLGLMLLKNYLNQEFKKLIAVCIQLIIIEL